MRALLIYLVFGLLPVFCDLEASISPNPVNVCDGKTTIIEVLTNKTAEEITVKWSTGEETAMIEVGVGSYSVDVTSLADGCVITKEIEVGNEVSGNIQSYLEEKGFYRLAVNIPEPGLNQSSTPRNNICDLSNCSDNNSGICIDNKAITPAIIFEGTQFSASELETMITNNLNFFQSEFGYDIATLIITDNSNVCDCTEDGFLDQVEEVFNNQIFGFWIHIFKDEISGKDGLYILANIPSTEAHAPNNLDLTNLLDVTVEKVKLSGNSGTFPNLIEKVLYIIKDNLLDNYLEDLSKTVEEISNNPTPNICEAILYSEPEEFISPSGIPLQLPANSIVRFGIKESYTGEIAKGALIGFTQLLEGGTQRNYYRSRIRKYLIDSRPEKFIGYYNSSLGFDGQTSKEEEPYLSPTFDDNLVVIGEKVERNGANVHETKTLPYTPTITVNNTGEGDLVADFSSTGIFGEPIETGVSPLDLPPITAQDYQLAEAIAYYNPFGKSGVLFPIKQPYRWDYLYALTDPNEPTAMLYFRWNCRLGVWQEVFEDSIDFPSDAAEKMCFFLAFFDVLTDVGHTVLDLGGMIPILGEPFDAVNGLWYVAEGNTTEAVLSFASVIPVVGTAVAGTKLGLKMQDAASGIARNVKGRFGRLKCPTLLATNESSARFNPGCKYFNVKRENIDFYNPDDILAKAQLDGFSPEQATRLMDWMLNHADPSILVKFVDNPGLVSAWKVLDDAGASLKSNILAVEKIDFLKSKGLTNGQLGNIGKLDDIKAIGLVENLAKRSSPPISSLVLNELDEIATFAKEIETTFGDLKLFDDLAELASNSNYHNVEDLKSWLISSKGNSGPSYKLELGEAKTDLLNGNIISLGKKNQFGNELDVVSESGKWVKECKRMDVTSTKKKTFNDNVKNIGAKFNDNKKLNLGERDFYMQNGGLKGVVEITNSSHPFYGQGKAFMGPHIQGIINGLPGTNTIKQGLKNMKELIIISGNNRIVLENGIDFL